MLGDHATASMGNLAEVSRESKAADEHQAGVVFAVRGQLRYSQSEPVGGFFETRGGAADNSAIAHLPSAAVGLAQLVAGMSREAASGEEREGCEAHHQADELLRAADCC